MGCLGNSKTEDQRNEEKAQRAANKKIEKQLQKDKQIYRATHRLLLLGEFAKREMLVCLFVCFLFFLKASENGSVCFAFTEPIVCFLAL